MSHDDPAIDHLLLRLRPIHRALRAAVERQAAAAARLDRPDLAPVCVTDQQVADLLDDVDHLIVSDGVPDTVAEPDADERDLERRFREEAAARGARLPLDRLVESLGLSTFEREVLLLCAAAELDHGYGRIFAYILDDLRRGHPCVELVCHLTAATARQRLTRRQAVGRFGKLRRCGLIEPFGELTTELHTPLRLAPGVLDFLTGVGPDALALWSDPAEPAPGSSAPGPPEVAASRQSRLSRGLAARALDVVAFWGRPVARAEDAAEAVARAAGLPLRRLSSENATALRDELHAAAALGAAVLVPTDALREPERRRFAAALAETLARTAIPCLLAGSEPWRPTALLAARAYAEVEMPAATYPDRRALWFDALPEADSPNLEDLAGRFRMSRLEVEAVARLARTQAALDSNGTAVRVEDRLDAACAAVARKGGDRFVNLVKPRRGPDDLILAPSLHRQVLEVSRFSRALPRVAESWGFGRLATGGSGLKVLFTGDPGTGKTLAAEVIAGRLSAPLLKVNLGQTVSKWIGETEKNLDEAFEEAEASHAVLFLDEADALCGKRGEVRHGSDRYANTEVCHLLQRLEDYEGLVVLASNLKENLDPAFLRRLHVVIHFPRPAEPERRRLWDLAFPPQAPVDPRLNRDLLARLDMTGAGILGAARTAALLAADRKDACIGMAHVVQGVVRQYGREGRMLSPTELGPYTHLLQES